VSKRSGEPKNLETLRAARILACFAPGTHPGVLGAAIQASLGYVPPRVLPDLAARSGIGVEGAEAAIAATPGLHLEPPGRHRVTICTGRTCAGAGGARLLRLARRRLGVEVFRATQDGAIRIEPFKCFGKCAMAPNIEIDGSVRGAMTEDRFVALLEMLRRR